MLNSKDLNRSNAVYLEQIQIADLLISYNIDNIVLYIEDTKDQLAIKPIIKFLKRLRSKLPSKNSADKYWSLDEDNLLYYNQKEFKKKVGDEIRTIPVGAPLHSEISHKGGFGALLIKAYESTNEFIKSLEELELELNKDKGQNTKQVVSQKRLIENERDFLKLLYDTIGSNFIIKNESKDFIDPNSYKKIEISHSKNSDLFPEELKKYQIGLLLKEIVSFQESLKDRITYLLNDEKGVNPIDYYEADRTLAQYLSNYKNKPKSKSYIEFTNHLKELFELLDKI